MYRGLSPLAALLRRLRVSTPPPALRGPSSSVPPNRTRAEEERVERELVPLVHQALVDEPADGLRDAANTAALFASTCPEEEFGYGRLIQAEALNMLDQAWSRDVTTFRVVAPAPATLPDDPVEFIRSAMNAMLAESLIPAWRRQTRTEPLYLTREQIDQLPRAQADEFAPWNPAVSLLAGLPVVEVVTVEESTPHLDGWLLTGFQVTKGALRSMSTNQRWQYEALYLTNPQLLRVMAITGQAPPDDWAQTLDRGGEISRLCNRPVYLADRAENSTPCIERWMDL